MDTSDASFSSIGLVDNFAFAQICPEGITFEWDAVTDAESYDVYLLGEKFMEVVGNSTTTSMLITVEDPTVTLWAAIVAKNETEGWSSRRTVAIVNEGGLLNCPLANDVGALEITNNPDDFLIFCSDIEGVIVSGVLSNTGTDPQSNFEVSYQLGNQPVVTEMYTGSLIPGEEVDFVFDTVLEIPNTGSFTLAMSANLTGDQNEFNDVASLEVFALVDATPLDYEQDFDTDGITPSGWSIINPDNNLTWSEAIGILGSDGAITNAAVVNNFAYGDPGQEDFLVTEFFDLNVDAAMLEFDLAKAQWNSQLIDRLIVEISVDCGESFFSIYDKTDLELSTLPDYNPTDAWAPTSTDEWRTEQIDLTPYLGETVLFRFVNVTGFSNNTYIDNIRLNQDQTLSIEENTVLLDIKLYPNPVTDNVFITLDDQTLADTSIVVSNSLGQTLQKISNQELGKSCLLYTSPSPRDS